MCDKINSINLSKASLITTATFALIMCCLQNGWDLMHFSYITFIFILFNAVSSFFKDDNGAVSFENEILRSVIQNSVTFVELIAFPFYLSEIIKLHEIHVGNFMPATLGLLTEFYYMVIDRNRTLVSTIVLLYATALFGVSLAVSNYFAMASALIFAAGEVNFEMGKNIYEVPTYVQFSFFIAAFTLTAHFGLVGQAAS